MQKNRLGSFSQKTTRINGDYIPALSDDLIICDTSGGDIQIVLPLPADFAQGGLNFRVMKVSAENVVSIVTMAGVPLIGSNSLSENNSWTEIATDGVSWFSFAA